MVFLNSPVMILSHSVASSASSSGKSSLLPRSSTDFAESIAHTQANAASGREEADATDSQYDNFHARKPFIDGHPPIEILSFTFLPKPKVVGGGIAERLGVPPPS